MLADFTETSTSGCVNDTFEGISSEFTDLTVVSESSQGVLLRAKRYGRWWMLKALAAAHRGDEVWRQRQRKEYEVLSMLQHPAIVSTAGMEDLPGYGSCVVMEYVDGYTLRQWLADEKPDRRRRRAAAMALAEAVAYMHSRGVVHRDLKPDNIMVSRRGDAVRVIDFGLADTDSYAVLKQPAGTPRYMSPQQSVEAVACPGNDVYSLGVVFGGMGLGMKRVVRRAADKDPARRYASAGALYAAMTRSLQRKRLNATVLAVLAVVAAVGAVAALTVTSPGRDQTAARTADGADGYGKSELPLTAELAEGEGEAAAFRGGAALRPQPLPQVSKVVRVDSLIEVGKRKVDAFAVSWPLRLHLDTLSSPLYFDRSLVSWGYVDVIDSFTGEIANVYDTGTAHAVRDELGRYAVERYATPVIENMNEVIRQKTLMDYEKFSK